MNHVLRLGVKHVKKDEFKDILTQLFDPKNVKGTVNSSYESVMTWGFFSYNVVGKLAFIHGTFKSEEYVNILKENLDEAV